MKKQILIGIILLSGISFSCSNEEEQDLNIYQQNIELYNTGERMKTFHYHLLK